MTVLAKTFNFFNQDCELSLVIFILYDPGFRFWTKIFFWKMLVLFTNSLSIYMSALEDGAVIYNPPTSVNLNSSLKRYPVVYKITIGTINIKITEATNRYILLLFLESGFILLFSMFWSYPKAKIFFKHQSGLRIKSWDCPKNNDCKGNYNPLQYHRYF